MGESSKRSTVSSRYSHLFHTLPHLSPEPPVEEREREKEKAPLEFVEKSYQELNSKKIKDSLSSFLTDIPGQILSPSCMCTQPPFTCPVSVSPTGEFDSIDSPDTM